MIQLNHMEVGDPQGTSPEAGTLVRFWQAEILDTGLFAITEEGFTRIPNSGEPHRYLHLTRFFVTDGPFFGHAVTGHVLIQDELNHGDHHRGPIGPAIRELSGPEPWIDDARQRMLTEAIDRHERASVQA